MTRPATAASFLIFFLVGLFPVFSGDWKKLDEKQTIKQMERISERLGSIQSMSVDFTQERTLSLFNETLVSRGKCLFQKPDSLRWEYSEPFQSLLLYNGGRAAKFERKGDRFVKVNQAGGDMIALVMEEILYWIQGDFSRSQDIYTVALMENSGILRFQLIPKSSDLRDVISEITLDFDKESCMTLAVSLVDGMGDSTSIKYSHQRNNVSLPSDCFNMKQPSVLE